MLHIIEFPLPKTPLLYEHSDAAARGPSLRGTAAPVAAIRGYTFGMKTAVSIPDEVFEKAERQAEREKRSRSEVYSAALREYVARHAPDEVTAAMNGAWDEVGSESDGFAAAAARRVLERVEW